MADSMRTKISPLDLQLVIRRIGWIRLLTLLICLTVGVIDGLIVPVVESRDLAGRPMLEVGNGATALTNHGSGDNGDSVRYKEFQARLIPQEARHELLKGLFSAATTQGLSLTQGDYELVPAGPGGYAKLQITLPIRGQYKQIRSYIDHLLVNIPGLSLDEITFRRDVVKNTTVDARLRLTVFMRGDI